MHFLPNINANFQSSKTSIIKTSINPSFQEKLVPKIKYIPNAMKFHNQSSSSSLIINMIFEIADLDPKLKPGADSKLQCA